NAGTYRVLQRVYDSLKTCFDTVAKSVTIVDTGSCNLTAAFYLYFDSLNCKTVHLVNISTPFSSQMHFAWKFGDGSSSNDVSPNHTYADTGTYTICLVVEEGANCRSQYCVTIKIQCQVPQCDLEAKYVVRHDAQQWNKIWFDNITQPVSKIWR